MSNVCSIIVTFNGEKWIHRCLDSLIASNVQTKIIVVDNKSSDNTLGLIQIHYPLVNIIQSEKNVGFGKANNIGLRKAYLEGADYVFLLNQDAWIEQDTIEKLISVGKSHPEYYLLSPVHLNKEGTGFDKGFINYALPPFCDNFFFDSFSSHKKGLYSTTFVNAAAWLLKMDSISEIGIFDPVFYHYGEDKDYCNRLLFYKKKIGIVTAALVYHARESSSLNNTNFIQNYKKKIYNNYYPVLIELKKLDLNLYRQTLICIYGLLKSFVKRIISFKFNKALFDLLVIFRTLTDYPTIKRHRKISLTKGAFLNS